MSTRRRILLVSRSGEIDISTAVVTASAQTYTGSALTPSVTVTLNGNVIPSSGYDVTYSNNVNAGTGNITVTGKNGYRGTATGTFTIAKANPTYTAPVASTNLTYNGSSKYLTTAGSTSHGTIYYSFDGTNWYTTRRIGTNAGTYTSYWKLTGDANHNDVARTAITTTIAKASRTISFSNPTTVVAPSGNVTNTATPSAGASDGTITYSISSTTYATINSSTGKVTAKTSEGSATVTATISEGTNYLSASASYTLYVFSTIHNFDYTGTVQSLLLPPGRYKLETWGAQGGSNAAASSYGITAKAGGKGGYSTGQLTLTSERTVYAFVGGQGSSSGNGGWNGGGGGSGSSAYNYSNTNGVSRMGCGGGGTDIALVTSTMSYSSYRTNRSSESLLSRMIVAGGGSGGAMCYKGVTTTTPVNDYSVSGSLMTDTSYNGDSVSSKVLTIKAASTYSSGLATITADTHSSSSTTTSNESQVGYVGGGTTGGGYSSTYQGKQNAAGSNGGFGYGANQTTTNYRYCSACGGGGWYGGGSGSASDSSMTYCKYSGGGSGFVNTSASAGNRPSGYTGLQLDSGTTYTGASSFPSPSGGNETGHSGNGYARITRI